MNLSENSIVEIDKHINRENKLLINDDLSYEINIDIGVVTINDESYNIKLESTNVSLMNKRIGEMVYYLSGYPFQICNKLIKIRGQMVHLENFILKVIHGRIRINNKYYSFIINNNILTIQNIIDYREYQMQNINNNIIEEFENNIVNNNNNNTIINNNLQPDLKKISKDSQNVHDSYILNYLYDILEKIKKLTNNEKSIDIVLNEITSYINLKQGYFNYIKHKIFNIENKGIKILNFMKKNNRYITKFRMTEMEILRLVWNAIGNNNDLKEIFYHNLLDIKNYNSYYCLTGRVTRIINTFSGIIENKQINMTEIRKEMMNKCTIIRNNLEKNNKNLDNELLKKEIKKELKKDYVDSKILLIEDFNKELNEWIELI